ncbi:hypothetical protein AVEN_106929-1 [Araneus ventricosus]|uniref:Uncharacterized protein n=1 Tax=Araneus ventricosus TaxID=182803 RepID=A0A4Y2JXH3_ARAVE|nr:hypothetical protein AVEN_106929-1 [Araneus ventricosus]
MRNLDKIGVGRAKGWNSNEVGFSFSLFDHKSNILFFEAGYKSHLFWGALGRGNVRGSCGRTGEIREGRGALTEKQTLPQVESSLIGRYAERKAGSFPSLRIRATQAFFHGSGKIAKFIQSFIVIVNFSILTLKNSKIIPADSPSGPGALFR